MIVLSRIDSRLIHGQVIEAWLPHLRVGRVVVADGATAGDALAREVMGLAVPPQIQIVLADPEALDFRALAADDVRTLVLFRDVSAVLAARARGLPDGLLNVGNVHAGPGRTPVSRSVFLTDADRNDLRALRTSGMQVVIQAVPAEAPVSVAQITSAA